MYSTADFLRPEARARQAVQPVYIDGMFAQLHRPRPNWGGETAVLICSALSRDALDSHRFLRVLGDEFAAAGYPALRLDYPGTGDSCDLADFPSAGNQWLAWQQGLHAAADYLRAQTGARRLIICGLRIGATLAALMAEQRDDVDGLILLAPVVRGQSYIRQLWVEAGLQQGQTGKLQDGFTFQELDFTAQAVAAIAQADLRTVKMPAAHIAIFAQSPSTPLTACETAWKQQGADITSMDFKGLESLLNHELEGDTAPADFSRLLDWANANIPPQPVFRATALPPGGAWLRMEGQIETPIGFGPDNGLFGILCEPETGEPDIAVIICGGGRNPHYGVGRSAVYLARHLAAAGIASLRMDFAGLGDSMGPPGRETMMTGLFDDRLPDIRAAVDRLAALGYRRFAIQGLCSGAFHAFHAALDDLRIGMLLLVNLPVFEECDDACSELVMRAALPLNFYVKRLSHKQTWIRLLSGSHDFASILNGQLHRFRDLVARLLRGARPAPATFAQSAMAKLSQRGVGTLFLFGPDEVGLFAVDKNFGPKGAALKKLENVTMSVIEGFDHLVCLPHSQEQAANAILDKLRSWRGPALARPGIGRTAAAGR